MNPIASTPAPPYFAVIFTSQKTNADEEHYQQTAARMFELASAQPGYLGMEHVGDPSGAAITISYWSSLDSIENWRRHGEHLEAQATGRSTWYEQYALRVCRVERASMFNQAADTLS